MSSIFDGPKFSQNFRLGCNRYWDVFGWNWKVSDDAGDGHDDADDGHDDADEGHEGTGTITISSSVFAVSSLCLRAPGGYNF